MVSIRDFRKLKIVNFKFLCNSYRVTRVIIFTRRMWRFSFDIKIIKLKLRIAMKNIEMTITITIFSGTDEMVK